jgi:hypothetical protein
MPVLYSQLLVLILPRRFLTSSADMPEIKQTHNSGSASSSFTARHFFIFITDRIHDLPLIVKRADDTKPMSSVLCGLRGNKTLDGTVLQ